MIDNRSAERYPSIDPQQLGRKLKQVCEAKGISASDLQQNLHLTSVQAVYLWFGGKRLPNIDNLYAISRYLGITMDELVSSERQEKAYDILKEEVLTEYEKRILFYWERLAAKSENCIENDATNNNLI